MAGCSMIRRYRREGGLAAALTIALALLGDAVAAEQGVRYRIGYLTSGSEVNRAFLAGMRELGYVQGRDFAIELRGAGQDLDRLPRLAAELVAARVQVIVTVTTPAALAAKRATAAIPIVMSTAGDPVGSGLVASLVRSGGNVTGLSFQGVEVIAKELELLKEAAPATARLAIIVNPAIPPEAAALAVLPELASRLGMAIRAFPAATLADYPAALAAAAGWRADALTAFENTVASSAAGRRALLDHAAQARIPAVFGSRQFAEEGALLAYGIDFPALHRRAAYYVDRILKGADPADLPLEQPVRFRLVVNLKTAKALGVALPPALLARVDEVIE